MSHIRRRGRLGTLALGLIIVGWIASTMLLFAIGVLGREVLERYGSLFIWPFFGLHVLAFVLGIAAIAVGEPRGKPITAIVLAGIVMVTGVYYFLPIVSRLLR